MAIHLASAMMLRMQVEMVARMASGDTLALAACSSQG